MIVVDPQVGRWVAAKIGGGCWYEGAGPCVGVVRNGVLAAGCFFYLYSPKGTIYVDLAIEAKHAAKQMLWAIGDYAFRQLDLRRLTLTAEEDNLAAINLHRRIGAEREATLRQAGRDGKDVFISVLWRDSAFWRKLSGEVKRTNRAGLQRPGHAAGGGERAGVPDSAVCEPAAGQYAGQYRLVAADEKWLGL